jgi:putative IMPACT (imprinted ancient) family translation regulator
VTAPDCRLVPAREGRSEIRERGSRFLGFASRAVDEKAARSAVDSLAHRFHDATHVCYAWNIRGNIRAADAGEPPGTAGRPLLDAIRASRLEETCLAVVRYFGGTKLGTGGLARCYREAGRLALEAAGAEEIFDAEEIHIEIPYERESEIFRLVDPPHVSAVGRDFGPRLRVRLRVRPSRLAEVRSRLSALRIEEVPPD